jgi:predicted acyltransferase
MAELQQRYLALDVFRGMTVCFMIIVNNPGDWGFVYAPLLHAPWHGFTPTDLVFPSFLFAVGNAMAFVMHRYNRDDAGAFWTKTLKRTFIIFLIGYLLHWLPPFREVGGTYEWKSIVSTRVPGVLQRIALCYFFASVILFYGSKKFAVWFSVIALFTYWIIMWYFGDPNDPFSLTGNAALSLDRYLMNDSLMYHGEGIAFDPEGLLSTLPSIVNVIGGYLAGDYIRRKGNNYETIAKLMIAGVALTFAALTWNMAFPINKKIWTSSFVLLTIGIDLFLLSVLIYVIEVVKKRNWTNFFTVFGKNPLFIYIVADVLAVLLSMIKVGDYSLGEWLYGDFFGSIANPVNASLMFALFCMLVCWAIGYVLDRRKIYIKV